MFGTCPTWVWHAHGTDSTRKFVPSTYESEGSPAQGAFPQCSFTRYLEQTARVFTSESGNCKKRMQQYACDVNNTSIRNKASAEHAVMNDYKIDWTNARIVTTEKVTASWLRMESLIMQTTCKRVNLNNRNLNVINARSLQQFLKPIQMNRFCWCIHCQQGFRAQSRNVINVCLVWSASLFVSNVRCRPHGIPSCCRLPCQHKECTNRNRRWGNGKAVYLFLLRKLFRYSALASLVLT